MYPASRTDRHSRRRKVGFTLIEILVALTVFSIMALVAYQGLERMTGIKLHLDQEMRFWRDLTRVFDRIETDFTQLSSRSWRNAAGKVQPPLLSSKKDDGSVQTEFIRLDGNRTPMHLAYRCQNKILSLLVWPGLDISTSQQSQEHILLTDVETCEISFLNQQNAWVADWRDEAAKVRPRGIRIKLEFANRGKFERVIALP